MPTPENSGAAASASARSLRQLLPLGNYAVRPIAPDAPAALLAGSFRLRPAIMRSLVMPLAALMARTVSRASARSGPAYPRFYHVATAAVARGPVRPHRRSGRTRSSRFGAGRELQYLAHLQLRAVHARVRVCQHLHRYPVRLGDLVERVTLDDRIRLGASCADSGATLVTAAASAVFVARPTKLGVTGAFVSGSAARWPHVRISRCRFGRDCRPDLRCGRFPLTALDQHPGQQQHVRCDNRPHDDLEPLPGVFAAALLAASPAR